MKSWRSKEDSLDDARVVRSLFVIVTLIRKLFHGPCPWSAKFHTAVNSGI